MGVVCGKCVEKNPPFPNSRSTPGALCRSSGYLPLPNKESTILMVTQFQSLTSPSYSRALVVGFPEDMSVVCLIFRSGAVPVARKKPNHQKRPCHVLPGWSTYSSEHEGVCVCWGQGGGGGGGGGGGCRHEVGY